MVYIDYDDGLLNFVTLVIKQSRNANDSMWQAFQETSLYKKDDRDALEIAHWIVEYLQDIEPSRFELQMKAKDFKKLVKLIKEGRNG